ncbi:MAG: transcription termination factor NusA [Chitinophagales bacterium]|jgi:N utilization substance protein A|nr:transcription termination factor NusA [Sphingobacteriales bacterium]
MNTIDLIDSFSEFKEQKNIDKVKMMRLLEDTFKTSLKKKYGNTDNFDVVVNTDKGQIEIYQIRTIVEDDAVMDKVKEVGITEAKKIDESFELGEETYEQIEIQEFSRRSIMAAKQTLNSRVTELEKDEVYKKYKEMVGEIVHGEVYQVWKNEILIMDDEGNELVLPKTEQIKSDFFKKGDTVRAVIKEVELRNNLPRVKLSRTDPKFLEAMLELEVSEVMEGIIAIKKVVREPGEKAKIAVESYDDRIDPVGACVGVKGSRIHGIVKELQNENIDIINYTSNFPLFIQRALAPAAINSVEIDEKNRRVKVWLEPDQVSLAIGKNGVNIKLASRLIDYKIDVYRDIDTDEEDIDLDEFKDEIEEWIIDEIKKVGCDTAKSVLSLTVEELAKRADLEEETIRDVMHILKSEFDKS